MLIGRCFGSSCLVVFDVDIVIVVVVVVVVVVVIVVVLSQTSWWMMQDFGVRSFSCQTQVELSLC